MWELLGGIVVLLVLAVAAALIWDRESVGMSEVQSAPRLVRAFIRWRGQWYPCTIVGHYVDDYWFVEGHSLPACYRRMDGTRRTHVHVRDLQDLSGQPIILTPPAAEDRALGSEPHSRPINRLPSPAASPDSRHGKDFSS